MEIDIVQFIASLFGDKATYVFVTCSVVGYVWTHVRPLLPARVLSRLPNILITALEFIAGNHLQCENTLLNDPKYHKRVTNQKDQ